MHIIRRALKLSTNFGTANISSAFRYTLIIIIIVENLTTVMMISNAIGTATFDNVPILRAKIRPDPFGNMSVQLSLTFSQK